jgi:putative phosphoesterase
MTRIGLISDTHGYIDDKLFQYFANCDKIWHAGDIGNIEVADILAAFRSLKAVYGNIDGTDVRISYPKIQRFICENVDVLITHIGGYPGHYDREVREILKSNPPKLFICGHSHILKIIYDKKFDLLHLNPGAAGKSGFHNIRTALRFAIDGKEIKDMEVIEIEKRH